MTPSELTGLTDVFEDTIHVLRRGNNDFSRSGWIDEEDAIAEMADMLAQLRSGSMPEKPKMKVVFAPAGPFQEISISSGWADEYLRLASRFDVELARASA